MGTQATITEDVITAPFDTDDNPVAEPEKEAAPEAKAEEQPEKEEPAQPKAAAPKDDGSKTRIVELERQLREAQESERYWAGRARGGQEPQHREAPPQPKPTAKKLTPAEFIDGLTERGQDFLDEIMRESGYVKRDDAAKVAEEVGTRIVQHARRTITVEQQIDQIPELRDPNSELYRATDRIFSEHVAADPSLKDSPSALLMAAKLAQAEIGKKTPPKRASRDYREDDETSGDIDSGARKRRIASQQGDLGRDTGSAPFDGDEDELGPEQRELIGRFAKWGVDEKSYRAAVAKDRRRR